MNIKINQIAVSLSCLLTILSQSAFAQEQWLRKHLSSDFYCEGGECGDIDQDGHIDIVAGPMIYYGPDFKTTSTLKPAKPYSIVGYSNHFLTYVSDFNNDKFPDVLIFDFPGEQTWLHINPGTDVRNQNTWPVHTALEHTDNESPMLVNIVGDTQPEIVCCNQGFFGYATRPNDLNNLWQFTAVSDQGGYQRYTHGIGVGDVDDDGDMDMLAAHGWWEQPAELSKQKDKAAWPFHTFKFAETGAQMYAVDLDLDGRTEIITCLQAHGYGLVVYRKVDSSTAAEGFEWSQRPIMTNDAATSPTQLAISQPHAIAIADINGDGLPDIISGKRFWAHQGHDVAENEPPYLVWFETQVAKQSNVLKFVPHIIDDDSGVGTQITICDLNGDAKLDIVSCSKRGINALLQTENDDQNSIESKQLVKSRAFEQPMTEAKDIDSLAFGNLGLENWMRQGAAFFKQPIMLKDVDDLSSPVKAYIDTGEIAGELAEGEMQSRPFVLQRPIITFELKNKSFKNQVVVLDHQSDETLAQTDAGSLSDDLKPITFDVRKHLGKTVVIKIIDADSASHLRLQKLRFE